MAKEKSDGEEGGNTQEPHKEYGELIKKAFLGGFAQEGGLVIPLSWRGHREVRETLTFGPGTKVEVSVNKRNFDVTVSLNGERYQTRSPHGSPTLIQRAATYLGGDQGKLNLEGGLTFRTQAEHTNAVSA